MKLRLSPRIRPARQSARRGRVLFFAISLALLWAGTSSAAQELSYSFAPAGQTRSEQARSSITGRVITDGGLPLAGAGIEASPLSGRTKGLRVTGADGQGNFKLDGLSPGAYAIRVSVPGYIPISGLGKYHRIGDHVTVTMASGGAVTGRVSDPAGEPVVMVRVRAFRVRDGGGRPVTPPTVTACRLTDDRGVYRLYGLESGSYIVAAGGSPLLYYGETLHKLDAPTYHPSSPRDTATEVLVRAGAEAAGIDIRYRGEPGHVVSGTFSGSIRFGTDFRGVSVKLHSASSGAVIEETHVTARNTSRGFAFHGVPDGDYYLTARGFFITEEAEGAASPPRRVSVRGADVTGVELPLAQLAFIHGRVTLEPASDDLLTEECKGLHGSLVAEVAIAAHRHDERGRRGFPPGVLPLTFTAAPDRRGEFRLLNLDSGPYHIETLLPAGILYVRSITVSTGSSSGDSVDAARRGLSLRPGEHSPDLLITLAEGAASLSGRVLEHSTGAALSSGLRVNLVPSEPEHQDDRLRFAEVIVESDGTFALTNLAPGRYSILVNAVSEDEMIEGVPRPLAWDASQRARLRQLALDAPVIDLQPCRQVADYTLRYEPQKTSPATALLLQRRIDDAER